MRPIDADTLYTLISKCESVVREEKINTKEDEGTFLLNSIRLNEIKALKHLVDIVPILDVKPVRHGKWEVKQQTKTFNDYMTISGKYPTCNLCGFAEIGPFNETNYCPNCGAKMDLE